MRELHGVIRLNWKSLPSLKQKALLFDKFHVYEYQDELSPDTLKDHSSGLLADYEFLQEHDVIRKATFADLTRQTTLDAESLIASRIRPLMGRRMEVESEEYEFCCNLGEDFNVRLLSAGLNMDYSLNTAPICKLPLPSPPATEPVSNQQNLQILTVVLDALITPDEGTSWADILEFKAEVADKLWDFRRFLHTLAAKQQTEAEIRDDFEWSLHEYTKAMDRFKLKRSVSFMETYIIPTVEALENFKPSSFLKGLVAIRKRKIELLESEATAPGRECAYVFDARKRFGNKQ